MYRKNTAGQFICVQLILTATGAVGTGLSPAARRCIDGTFAAGGGTFTEDGTTGSYKYALSQADTNGNNISIIVTATGCIPVCVNFVTTAADPTDSVRFGLTALPNAAAEAAGGLYTRGSGAGQINQPANGMIDTNVVRNAGTAITSAAGIQEVKVASIAANAITAAATAADFGAEVADAVLDRDMATGADNGSSTVRTARQALRFLRNKWTIIGTTLTVYKEDDSATSWTSTVTATNGADPITANDPAGP